MSTPSSLLLESVQYFTTYSTEFQNHISGLDISGRDDYMYSKSAYELGAAFNSIMKKLIRLEPIFNKYNYHPKHLPKYTSYKEYRSYGIFTRAAPAPGPLKWDSEDSYEMRLLQVLYKDFAVRRGEFNTLNAVHAAIRNGVDQAIAAQTNGVTAQTNGVTAQTNGVTVVQNPLSAPVTEIPRSNTPAVETQRSTIQDWPNSLPGAVYDEREDDERKSLLRGGGHITRRRRRKGKRGSRRN